MPSRGVQISSTPVDIVTALGLEPDRSYLVQSQDAGGEVRLLEGNDRPSRSTPPDPAVVDRDDADTLGVQEARPIRLLDQATVEIRPGGGPYFYPVYAWLPSGTAWLVANEIV